MRNRLSLIILILLFLPLISAVQLNSGVVLNTSVSHTAMTFYNLNISSELVRIDANNITLYGVAYSTSDLTVNNITTPILLNENNTEFQSTGLPRLGINTDEQKKISSNLNHSVNASITISFSEPYINTLRRINYRSDNGYQQTIDKADLTFNGNFVTLSINNIDPGTQNVLTTVGGCSIRESGILIGIKIMSALAVVIFGMVFWWKKDDILQKVDVKILIFGFVGIIIGIIFVNAIANGIFSYCGI